MGTEFELKYKASPVLQQAIAREYTGFTEISMETTYYDTPGKALSSRRILMRRRMENGIAICTVKTPETEGVRGEWEIACDDVATAIPKLCKLGAPKELHTWAKEGLVPLCGARFTRSIAMIEHEDFIAELALDSGVLLGAGKEMPLCEVELELKSGSREALVAYATAFAEKYSLAAEPASKFRRALALTTGD